MAWSGRLQEHRAPEKVIPGRRTLSESFDGEAGPLQCRDSVVGQFTVIFESCFKSFTKARLAIGNLA